ncbi:MAG: CPBP family glutamic-type intramembrane protease [Myxococcota bacterium]
MTSTERGDHGWWPYVAPYAAFLLMSEIAARLPASLDPIALAMKPALTLALIGWFWRQGHYPELRGAAARIGWGGALQDVLVGLALTVVWVLPFILFPEIRPDPGGEFDPGMAGGEWILLILFLRFFGYALVTPLFEELFIRSFVMRIASVWNSDHDFRDQPLARYTRQSMVVTVIVFCLGHIPWEWWVCVPWLVLSNLWFYHRRRVSAMILVHSVTNAALLALAVFGDKLIRNQDGSFFSFWFFV